MWGNGARIIDDNLNYDGVMNSDKMVEAVTWYTSFVKEGLAPESTSLIAMGGPEEMFKAGKVAMIYWFPGLIEAINLAGDFDLLDNLGVVMLPVAKEGDKPAVDILYTNAICISKDSKNKNEAFKFLAARVGKETQKEFVSLGWALPTTTDLIYELKLLDDPLLKVFADPLVNPDKYVFPKPVEVYSPIAEVIIEHMNNAINKIVIGDEDPKKALDEAVANVKKAEETR